jgi:hypothetical protein
MSSIWPVVVPATITGLATVGTAGLTLIFGGTRSRGRGRLRRNIRHDVEMAEKLQGDSDAKSILMDHIRWEVQELANIEREGSRDTDMALGAAVVSLITGYISVALFYLGSWWIWLAVFTSIMTLIFLGFMISGLRIKRQTPDVDKQTPDVASRS